VSRRDLLRVGGLGVLGLGLGDLLAAKSARASQDETDTPRGKAKACILLFMWGGPSQLDTWDPKPDAPEEIRGEFRPIATRVPGTNISEHFPRLAQMADRYALIRSMTHDDPAHLSSVHHILTGRLAPKVKSDADPPSRKDSPAIGSALARLRPSGLPIPPFVTMPWICSHPAAPGGKAPGQNAGWLGPAYDPFLLAADPAAPNFTIPELVRSPELNDQRMEARRNLVAVIDESDKPESMSNPLQQAMDLLTSDHARRAFDLTREPDAIRDRYGRNTHGQCVLLARRLIEAGVRLVCVNWQQDGQFFWDTHNNNFTGLKTRLMPPADQALSALLDDLSQRGMLDETLVAWVGEFGRTPRIDRSKGGGREHHPGCYSALLAGAGIHGGMVYGRSDRHAAFPAENPVSPADFTATIYHALGIAPTATIQDREGRALVLTDGTPVTALFD
jgi:hypothetical protein